MSVVMSGEITAIATAILSFFAIITAVFAFLAFRKQAQEVSDEATMLKLQYEQLEEQRKINEEQTKVLALQASELDESLKERKREAEQRRSAQASQVFVWEERADVQAIGERTEPTVTAHVRNTSDQPVYDVWFSWRSGDVPHKPIRREKPLMPGEEDSHSVPVPDGADPATFGAVVIFRDHAKLWWRAHPDGQFDELPPGSEPPHVW